MLVFVLLLSVLFSAWLDHRYNSYLRQLQQLQPQVAYINNSRAILQAFGNDIGEYVKKNPSAGPILQSLQSSAGKSPSATGVKSAK